MDGSVSFNKYQFANIESSKTRNNSVLCLQEDSNGFLWIGSREGLHKLNVEEEEFRVYRMKDGLPSNTVVGILEDEEGMIWVSSLNGLSQLNPETDVIKNYTADDGIQGHKFSNRDAVLKSKSGELFFGGNNGFTVFNPVDFKFNNVFNPVYLSDFKLFNKSVEIAADDSPLDRHISESKMIELNYQQSVFTIEFVALYYLSVEKIEYAYKLEGLEDEWNYVGRRRSATYTNLDAGKYEFKVKSTNTEGDWNTEYASLIIIVNPPWWETIWFRFIAFLLFGVLLYLAYRLKIGSINRQKLLLQETVLIRTQELYEKNSELEEINEEVIQQKEELISQAEVLEQTNQQLEIKTNELSLHKLNLENVVEERTSQLEKEKERAEESDQLKTAFLANMSHEIRTPLNAIVGFSHLLDEPDITKDEQRDYIDSIDTNTASLLKLIDDILDLSMIESNQVHIDSSEINVEKLLDDVFSSGTVLNSNVELRLQKPDELSEVSIHSDFIRIKQILFNLFNNACKFTESGFVELGCRLVNNDIAFYVKDTGIGISKGNMEVIFNRFRKITDEKTKLFRGAGLGLAISKKLADLLNGELLVESELGKGTTFTFIMPASKRTFKTEEKKTKSSYKTGIIWDNHTVLIVEDEKTNFNYLRSVLKSTKINISWAQNGREAVELFNNQMSFDVVLMDIKMPEMNGYDATIAIKAMVPNQVIIAQTAYARPNDMKEISKAGFDAYIVKPIIPKDLFELLRKSLR